MPTNARRTQDLLNRLSEIACREFSDLPPPDFLMGLELFKHNTIMVASAHLSRTEADYISKYGHPSATKQ